jgi:thiamine-phosphate pyrophosphorylase
MRLKEKLLRDARLYLILDAQVNSYRELFKIVKTAVHGGAHVVQLRDKLGNTRQIFEFSKKIAAYLRGRIPFIVNDRVDVAIAARAAGVHLGQEDLPLPEARRLMGQKAIIGVSCQSYAQAKEARRQGADYIGFGSVFKTLTKPQREPMDLQLLQRVARDIDIPVFAIGGIDAGNIGRLRKMGVERFAVCRAVCRARDVGGALKALIPSGLSRLTDPRRRLARSPAQTVLASQENSHVLLKTSRG